MSVEESVQGLASVTRAPAFTSEAVPTKPKSRRLLELLLVALLVVAALVPFIDRALHLDDPFYVWVAQHIAKDPLDFYGFTLNWNGHDEYVYDINKNPPGVSYYLAAVGGLFGWKESNYHAALMLVAVAAAIGIYVVAERLTRYALLATLVAIASPVFLLSATNVMAEMGMLMFYVWALYFWMRGIQEDRFAFLVLAAVLAALSTLTKYYGLSAIPLFLAYGLAEKRRFGWWMGSLLVTVAILAFYEWYTSRLYGQGHLSGSILYAEQSGLRRHPTHIRMVIGLAFAGGCLFPVVLYSLFLWPWRVLFAAGVAVLAATSVLITGPLGRFFVVEPRLGTNEPFYAFQFVVLVVSGISLFLLALRDLYVRRDTASLLLFLWLTGTFVFAVRLNWAINGRSLLAAAVPAGMYIARAWELRGMGAGRFQWRLYTPLIPAACLAMTVAYADYTQANTFRFASLHLRTNFGGSNHTIWYQGHWGFQYYMDEIGAKHTKTTGIDVTDGDYFVSPYYNTAMHNLHTDIVRQHWYLRLQPFKWLTTWNPQVGAGYYADSWGPMPFVFTRVPPEQFIVASIRYTGTLRVEGEESPSAPTPE